MGATIWTIADEEQLALVAGPVGSVWAPGALAADEVVTGLFTESFTGSGEYFAHSPDTAPVDFSWESVTPEGQTLSGTGILAASSNFGEYFQAVSSAATAGWTTVPFPSVFKLELNVTVRGEAETLESELSYALVELAQASTRWILNIDRSEKVGHLQFEYPIAEGVTQITVPDVFINLPGTVLLAAFINLDTLAFNLVYSGTALSSEGTYTVELTGVDLDQTVLQEVRLAGAGVDFDFVEFIEEAIT